MCCPHAENERSSHSSSRRSPSPPLPPAHDAHAQGARRSSPPTPRGPRPSRPRPTPSPLRRPARSSPSAASPPCSRARTARTWRCPTTASAARRNSHSFLLRVYAVDSHRKDARILGAHQPRTIPNPQDPVHAHQRRDRAALSDRRRLRHRVVPHRSPRHAVVRRRVRAVPAPHGPHRQGARGRRSRCRACARADTRPTPRRRRQGNLASSNGFEGMAISPDGRTLYPTLEGPLADDADKTIRRVVHVRHRQARATSPATASTTSPTRATSCPTSRHWTRSASSRSSATTSRARPPCTSRRSWSPAQVVVTPDGDALNTARCSTS